MDVIYLLMVEICSEKCEIYVSPLNPGKPIFFRRNNSLSSYVKVKIDVLFLNGRRNLYENEK